MRRAHTDPVTYGNCRALVYDGVCYYSRSVARLINGDSYGTSPVIFRSTGTVLNEILSGIRVEEVGGWSNTVSGRSSASPKPQRYYSNSASYYNAICGNHVRRIFPTDPVETETHR
ncbi:hypothetical protein GWI33_005613 [Rhynchophorus ferrugineus]|uniref:Uncharacterized protein n=1 Tax=Rhynchophorus ferrugineus TaxID=354439 RepID=A0A834IH53_RHYFE|nr:hypothetical protein GWI33_005613 [Rhynchophorus ferrugineus]